MFQSRDSLLNVDIYYLLRDNGWTLRLDESASQNVILRKQIDFYSSIWVMYYRSSGEIDIHGEAMTLADLQLVGEIMKYYMIRDGIIPMEIEKNKTQVG